MNDNILYINENDADISIILLHGLGASGRHFIALAEQIQQRLSIKAKFILPTAPIQPVKWAGGRSVTAWYDLRNDDFLKDEDKEGLLNSADFCQNLIKKEIENGFSPNQIFIGGFSQGGAISLLAGLNFSEKLAGIFALSSYLPIPNEMESIIENSLNKSPIFLGHGLYDRIITPKQLEIGKNILANNDFEVDYHTYPIEHNVSAEEIEDLTKWIDKKYNNF